MPTELSTSTARNSKILKEAIEKDNLYFFMKLIYKNNKAVSVAMDTNYFGITITDPAGKKCHIK